jgi:hypothetical protein
MNGSGLRLCAGAALLLGLGGFTLRERLPDGESVAALLRRPGLELRRVDLVGSRALAPQELVQLAGIAAGQALVDVDPRAVAEAVASHPRVARARAVRVPPGLLVIGITEREPIARDAATQAGLDREGNAFTLLPEERDALPAVRGDLPRALAAVGAARELGIELAQIDAHDHGSRVEPRGEGLTLHLGSEPQRELASWLVLRRSGLLARHRAREIDLRFEGSAVLRNIQTGDEEGETDGSQR